MNSLWNSNIARFRQRFPDLSGLLAADIERFAENKAGCPLIVTEAKNGSPTAYERQQAEPRQPLHSTYNPEREAAGLAKGFAPEHYGAAAFLGFGLGYAPIAFAQAFPGTPLILIENDPAHLLAAFAALDWEPVWRHQQVAIAITEDARAAAGILEHYRGSRLRIYASAAQTAHGKEFFAAVSALHQQGIQKEEINTNTLERFAHLWLRNSCKNLHYLGELDGVKKFFGLVPRLEGELPFVILAAGPSLSSVLPALPELKKRAVIVCVDTALHACLGTGTEPDFVVLVDPQYVCARHLDFLAAPSAILITESAAWPSVFRFPCKEVVLCSSLFPIGQYYEKQLGDKGRLGTGGSVATTAWDFARNCGARSIYLAGMDLGFPGGQTHIRGSQFEERAHRTASRTHTAEQDNVAALMGAQPATVADYGGRPLRTDKRMSLYAWWFERSCATAMQDGQHTYTLTPQSMAIPGIQPAGIDALLAAPERQSQRERFFALARAQRMARRPDFAAVHLQFLHELEALARLAQKGRMLCEKGIRNRARAPQMCAALEDIDRQILCSQGKDAAALVFPTQRQLDALARNLPADKALRPLYYSRLIYTELAKAVDAYRQALARP